MIAKKCALIVAVLAVCFPQLLSGAWTIDEPSLMEELNKSMTVVCNGDGDGAATSLYIGIYRDSTLLNHGTGSWGGGPADWTGDVAPPTGGFGTGAATVKLWKYGDQGTEDPLAMQAVEFN